MLAGKKVIGHAKKAHLQVGVFYKTKYSVNTILFEFARLAHMIYSNTL